MNAPGPASFQEVWQTLGLAGRELAFDATVTPETLARAAGLVAGLEATITAPMAATEVGLPLATLPRLSIETGRIGTPEHGGPEDPDISVIGVLGEGGMGRVLLARQRSLAREVAVKTVHEALVGTMHARALVTEGLITGHLEHPNITPVHQLGVDRNGRPLLVMKRIAGVVWRELIDDPNHPAWARIPTLPTDRLRAHLEILMQVCNGLSFAHSRAVVHRDVKPDNVMIGEFGEVYLCDWGIGVKLPLSPDAVHGLVGTPSYLAPEMLERHGDIASSIDVYLLGGTLHTILTGRPRHEGSTLEAVLESAHVSAPVTYPPSVDRELGALANRATTRDPAHRPSSALAFRREIADYISHRTSVALSDAAWALLRELRASSTEPSRDRAALSRKATECRFGFVQSLREWPESPEAEAGLEQCLAAAVRLELDGENADTARSLLGEMRAPRGELSADVDALAARLARRAEDAKKLHELRHEGDLTVGAKPRARLMAGLLGVALSMSLGSLVIRRAGGDPNSTFGRVVFLSIIFGAASLGTFTWRRQLLSNRVNRQTAAVLLGSMGLEWLHAVECSITDATSRESHLSGMFIVAATTGTASVFITRKWAIPSGVLIVCSLVATFAPALTIPAFVVGHMSILVTLALVHRAAKE